jgi:hypothetical protein
MQALPLQKEKKIEMMFAIKFCFTIFAVRFQKSVKSCQKFAKYQVRDQE